MLRDTAREKYEILVDGIGRESIKLYKNRREAKNLLPFRVIELGFEPKTHSLEGCCSIQLSYQTNPNTDGDGLQWFQLQSYIKFLILQSIITEKYIFAALNRII